MYKYFLYCPFPFLILLSQTFVFLLLQVFNKKISSSIFNTSCLGLKIKLKICIIKFKQNQF